MRAADGGLPPANQAGATKPDVDSPNPAEADLAVNEANGNEATLEQPATATVGGKGGARWSDVEICFLDADHAQVTVLEKVTRLSYAEMGFGDRRVNFLGHGVGLQIDEPPVLAEGFNEPLAAGMVLALEPKKGVPGVGMGGSENNYLVSPGGGRSLTGNSPGLILV